MKASVYDGEIPDRAHSRWVILLDRINQNGNRTIKIEGENVKTARTITSSIHNAIKRTRHNMKVTLRGTDVYITNLNVVDKPQK